jgi:ribulose-5-phosphate 4-epimerase/fuculose-1-phosphate aldolase
MPTNLLAARIDIATAFRWGAKMGLNEGVNGGHLSYAAPGMEGRFFAIPNGLHWAEVTPNNLILVDHHGNTLEGQGRIERSNLHIHAGIHRARSDARCVLHAHMPFATALSIIKGARLEPIGQQSLRFYGRIAYYDEFNALAHSDDEGDRMGAALADKAVLFLQSHGVIVVGPTVGQAFDDLYYLERACMNQIHAMSSGAELHKIPERMAELAIKQYMGQRENSELHFESLKRMLTAEDSRFRTDLAQAAE